MKLPKQVKPVERKPSSEHFNQKEVTASDCCGYGRKCVQGYCYGGIQCTGYCVNA